MGFFSCKHPFRALQSRKPHTIKITDSNLLVVTTYFRCILCDEKLEKSHSEFRGGVDGFLEKGFSEYSPSD